uniref:UTP--glucose-1-phosphate uridylyltransferase n=1 Tax=Heterorhabditis bacteriophora TaxID=37862 RepID=A0A1I7W9N0_HETBA
MLNKLVVVKLNGGLGTSMGCKGPKSTTNNKLHVSATVLIFPISNLLIQLYEISSAGIYSNASGILLATETSMKLFITLDFWMNLSLREKSSYNKGIILACGINVPRSRFLPVKKSSDLLLLMSNLYDIDKGSLTLSEQRSFPTTPLCLISEIAFIFAKLNISFQEIS